MLKQDSLDSSSLKFRLLVISIIILDLISHANSQDCNSNKCTHCHCGKERQCRALVNHSVITYPNFKDYRTPDFIEYYGYPVEEHKIHTKDKYILTVQRIPYSDKSPPNKEKVPVFLMHGFLASSVQWVLQDPTKNLAFMLVDAGYDVWLGNARATTYSTEHEYLPVNDPNNLTYWDTSSDEMGMYDIPACIEYITNITGHPSIYYICHSLGCELILTAVITEPELNKKIRTSFFLNPAIYKGNSCNIVFTPGSCIFAQYPVEQIVNRIGEGRFLPSAIEHFLGNVSASCPNGLVLCSLCKSLYFLSFGFDPCQTNYTVLPILLAHLPDTISAKTYSHIMQDACYGTYRRYDYGLAMNLEKYGAPTPPDYDLDKVDQSIVIYWGECDNLVTEKDVDKLTRGLKSNVKEINMINCWTHLASVVGIDAKELIYEPIIKAMNDRTYG